MPTSSSSSRKRGVDRGFARVHAAAGQRPLRRVRSEARCSAAQQECGTTGHVDHAAVEAGLRHRASCDPVVHRRRIDPVLTDLGVDQHHRDGRVPLGRVGHDATVVTRQMVPGSAHAAPRHMRWASAERKRKGSALLTAMTCRVRRSAD